MKITRIGAGVLAGLLLVGACSGGARTSPSASSPASPGADESSTPAASGSASSAPASMDHGSMSPSPSAGASGSPSTSPGASVGTGVDITSDAATLRTDLNYLLGEHLILAAKATGAALGGRTDQFNAYGALLNTNGTDLGAAIGSIYGSEAEDEWNRIWSAHNGFFVDYTTGVGAADQAMQDQAVEDLTTIYVPEFSAFLAGATDLPEDAIAQLVTDHVLQTKAVVDAQAAGDFAGAYAAIRTAYAHMSMMGDALAPAIATKNSIEGDAANPGVGFRTALNNLLQEHLFLASFATDAALGGRDNEFTAAGDALNTNGTDLGAAIGNVYGSDAQDEFNRIWSAHNGFFVDYTTGVGAGDQAMMDQAVEDLTTVYVPEFSAFLAGATGLPEDAVADLVTDHVLTTKAIVDAQGAGDVAGAADADRDAAMHMRMIGDPLAEAIVSSMPDSFR